MTDNRMLGRAASALCSSGKFETGQGTCAAICMGQLGSARSGPCAHRVQVHEELARRVLQRALTEPRRLALSHPTPWRFMRSQYGLEPDDEMDDLEIHDANGKVVMLVYSAEIGATLADLMNSVVDADLGETIVDKEKAPL